MKYLLSLLILSGSNLLGIDSGIQLIAIGYSVFYLQKPWKVQSVSTKPASGSNRTLNGTLELENNGQTVTAYAILRAYRDRFKLLTDLNEKPPWIKNKE